MGATGVGPRCHRRVIGEGCRQSGLVVRRVNPVTAPLRLLF